MLRGVATLVGGIIVLTAFIVIAYYIMHLASVADLVIKEEARLYDEARMIAANANISDYTINLPEPADIIVIDPNGVPHAARNVTSVDVPWELSDSKVYVVKTGRLTVVPSSPAAGVALLAAVASAPLLQQQAASNLTGGCPDNYLDPLFLNFQDSIDVNMYRGYCYDGPYNLTNDIPWITLPHPVILDLYYKGTTFNITYGYGTMYVICNGTIVLSVSNSETNETLTCGPMNITVYLDASASWSYQSYKYTVTIISEYWNYTGSGSYTVSWWSRYSSVTAKLIYTHDRDFVFMLEPDYISVTFYSSGNTVKYLDKHILDPTANGTAYYETYDDRDGFTPSGDALAKYIVIYYNGQYAGKTLLPRDFYGYKFTK